MKIGGGGYGARFFQWQKKEKRNKKCQFLGNHFGFSYFHFLQTGKKQVGWGSMHRSPSPYRSGRAQGASVWRRIRIIKSRVKSQFFIWCATIRERIIPSRIFSKCGGVGAPSLPSRTTVLLPLPLSPLYPGWWGPKYG